MEVHREWQRISTRARIFKELKQHLDKACVTIAEAINTVKINATNDPDQNGFEARDFNQICLVFKFPIQEQEIKDILDTMDRDAFGEIPQSVFIREFENQFQSKEGAVRFLLSNKKRFEILARYIEDR